MEKTLEDRLKLLEHHARYNAAVDSAFDRDISDVRSRLRQVQATVEAVSVGQVEQTINFNGRLADLEEKLADLEEKVERGFGDLAENIHQRLAGLEETVDQRLAKFEAKAERRLTDVERKFDRRFIDIQGAVKGLGSRVGQLEGKVDEVDVKLDQVIVLLTPAPVE
jgi:hypothetical protein